MTPTALGVVVILIALALFFMASRMTLLIYLMFCTLLSGSAAFYLSALGNTSIQPALAILPLLLLRCLIAPPGDKPQLAPTLANNSWLILLVAYGAMGAFLLPIVFAGSIDVVPMRPTDNPTGMTTSPLKFTPQNITTAFYSVLTLMGSLSATLAITRPGSGGTIARTACKIGLIHVGIGWFAVAVAHTPLNALVQFFRNGSYMQLNQSFGSYARITGISPEPSIYASVAFTWFIFSMELWLRNIETRWSGPAVLTLFLTLLLSTSSTAYAGLAAYSAVLMLRLLFTVGDIPFRKSFAMAICLLTLLACALMLLVGSEAIVAAAGRIIRLTTADKLESESGMARTFWAKQGFEAFLHSWGLGIGAGSFRSSSLMTAVLGSSGVIGIVALIAHVLRIFRPLSRSTYASIVELDAGVANAGGWTVLMMMAPASISAPSPDPGLLWGLLGGLVLGLRANMRPPGEARADTTL